MEQTLVQVQEHTVFIKAIQHCQIGLDMFREIVVEGTSVIQVIHHVQSGYWFEYFRHPSLEICRGISKSECHHIHDIRTIRCHEGSFPPILFLNTELIITHLKVEFGKELGTMHAFQCFVDAREGKTVFDHDVIQFLVVDDWSSSTILLPYEEERSS